MNGTELNGKPVYEHIDSTDYNYLFFKLNEGWISGYNHDKVPGFNPNANASEPTKWEEYKNPVQSWFSLFLNYTDYRYCVQDTEAECPETANATWQYYDWETPWADDDTLGVECSECKLYASQPECGECY